MHSPILVLYTTSAADIHGHPLLVLILPLCLKAGLCLENGLIADGPLALLIEVQHVLQVLLVQAAFVEHRLVSSVSWQSLQETLP